MHMHNSLRAYLILNDHDRSTNQASLFYICASAQNPEPPDQIVIDHMSVQAHAHVHRVRAHFQKPKPKPNPNPAMAVAVGKFKEEIRK